MSMKQFYVGVKAVVIKKDRLLLLKAAGKDWWDMPGGRIDGNETIKQALRRELSEELPNHKNLNIGQLIGARRIPGSPFGELGLTLLFYRVELDLPPEIELSHEHTAAEWVPLSEVGDRPMGGVEDLLGMLKQR